MVKVCDAIMGSGKSSAAITYMNEHPDDLFIYITPYLDEASRIKKACPALRFVEPKKLAEFGGSKTKHTLELICENRNIATTHSAFRGYPPELLAEIKERGYTLIIDEDVSVLASLDTDPGDVQMAIDAGYIGEVEPGVYGLMKDVYHGHALKDLFRVIRSRNLIRISGDESDEQLFFWELPPELLTSFKDVIILTYLFEGQDLYYLLTMYSIPYEMIGVEPDETGTYRFCEAGKHVPEYTRHMRDMISVLDHERLNQIGDTRTALSMSWMKNEDEIEQLKRNIAYYYRWFCKRDVHKAMWSTYTEFKQKLRGKGYTNGFVSWNQKSSNDFRERENLAYCVNLYMNVGRKLFFRKRGVVVDDDAYALSAMVQWVWRSAIRDGKPIQIYVPSRRMRELLIDWIDSFETGGDAVG